MLSQAEIYSEIARTVSRLFSGLSLTLASFISIVFVLALDVEDNVVTVGGYEVAFTPTLVIFSVFLSFSFLTIACLLLALLLLLEEPQNDSSHDN